MNYPQDRLYSADHEWIGLDNPARVGITAHAAQALDDDPQVRNRFHEFVAAKPPWYEICDGAKQFAEHPS